MTVTDLSKVQKTVLWLTRNLNYRESVQEHLKC